jgi:hypothetical protein
MSEEVSMKGNTGTVNSHIIQIELGIIDNIAREKMKNIFIKVQVVLLTK